MADKDSYNLGSSVPGDIFLQFSIKVNYFFDRKIICPTFALAKNGTDSVAQLVEHIPFKDGVLGSNPSWITKSIPRKRDFLFERPDEACFVKVLRNKKRPPKVDAFCQGPPLGIMPPSGGIIPAKLKSIYFMWSNPPSLQAVPFAKIAHRAIFLRSVRFESQLDHKKHPAQAGFFI